MRPRIPTILAAAALLLPGAKGAFTSLLAADHGVTGLDAATGAVVFSVPITNWFVNSTTVLSSKPIPVGPSCDIELNPLRGTGSAARDLTIILAGNTRFGAAPGGRPSLATSGTLASGKTVLPHAAGSTRYGGGATIPEPASLTLLGAALLGFSKLLRKRLCRSKTTLGLFIEKHADEYGGEN